MLYSILPPIIVVLSLVGIIIFLVKKASQIKKACQEESVQFAKKEIFSEDAAIGNKEEGTGKWKKAENVFLAILEKTTRRLRTFFLKLEVWFSGLSGKIRNRRRQTISKINKTNGLMDQQEEILEKIISYKSKDVSENKSAEKENFQMPIETEKVTEPMISKKATLPKTMPKIKSKLEDLLIERVAANPKDIEAYERLGEYYMEIESYNDAKECFKQVMKLSPTSRDVKYKIKRLERLLGE